ncbi:MAG TPA: ABC transporter permease [Terriglobia bacterium]
MSYGLWQRRYGGSPALVGRTITIDGQAFAVVGVMPRQFQWQLWAPSQLWVPMGYTKQDYQRDWNSFVVIGRLKPAATMPQAQAEMDGVANRLPDVRPFLIRPGFRDSPTVPLDLMDYNVVDGRQVIGAGDLSEALEVPVGGLGVGRGGFCGVSPVKKPR